MRVWRICRKVHAADPLNGRGGLFVSGRWHSRGNRIVYTASALSLAALELLVHSSRDCLPTDLVRVEIDVPDKLKRTTLTADDLPKNWLRYPAPVSLKKIGDRWLSEEKTPLLCVPSAVIPEESNWLINPQHPASKAIKVRSKRRFAYDVRLGTE